MSASHTDNAPHVIWPNDGYDRIPYQIYSDPEVYRRELETIFYGDNWGFVALEAEIPKSGDFKSAWIGERPVVVTRAGDGSVNVVANRCAHRGVKFCHQEAGNAENFTCPYHQWMYDLKGNLLGVPFRRGIDGQGGMPKDFDRANHGLDKLQVHCENGAIFASFSPTVVPFADFLGPQMLCYFNRVFDGRELTLLGHSRQLIPGNWKLMMENLKDPYHASLLHIFLITFGLFRADNQSSVAMDDTGRHACLISKRGEQKHTENTRDIKRLWEDFKLRDPRILDPVIEFPGDATVVMQTLWPSLIIQQQSNTLAMRQIVPRGPGGHELRWTYFGYADDDEEMTRRRLRQANLMGPAGLVSVDDSEVLKVSQDGIEPFEKLSAVAEMGGREAESQDHMVTEVGVRGFYKYYRQVMGL